MRNPGEARLIDSPQWRRERKRYLKDNPLCVKHLARGDTVAANEVDHVIPHRGDPVLFWARDNWQALCKPCHSEKTATEDGGFGRPGRPSITRVVVTGERGDGLSTWVQEHAGTAAVVFDYDVLARAIAKEPGFPPPVMVHRALMAMRGGLVQWLSKAPPECSVYLIVADRTEAVAIAKRIRAELRVIEGGTG